MTISFFKANAVYCDYLRLSDPVVPYTMEQKNTRPFIRMMCTKINIWCEENYDGYFLCDKNIKTDYTLIVKGDSMVDAEIYDGDLVFVKKSSYVENGRIVAVLLEDDNEVHKKVYV